MMRNKDYFSEMGIDPSQLENSLDAVSDRVITAVTDVMGSAIALNPAR